MDIFKIAVSAFNYVALAFFPGLLFVRLVKSRLIWPDFFIFPSVLSPLFVIVISFLLSFLGRVPIQTIAVILPLGFGIASIVIFSVKGINVPSQLWNIDTRTLLAIFCLPLTLVGLFLLIFSSSSFELYLWDTGFQNKITYHIAHNNIPPRNPFIATSSRLFYHWTFNIYMAVLYLSTDIHLPHLWVVINLQAIFSFCLAVHLLASEYLHTGVGRNAAVLFSFFGLNSFAVIWLLRLFVGTQKGFEPITMGNIDEINNLLVFGYTKMLSSLVHKFLEGNNFPVTFAPVILILFLAIRVINSREASDKVFFIATLTALHFIHLLSGLLVTIGLFIATFFLCMIKRIPVRQSIEIISSLSISILLVLPYLLYTSLGKNHVLTLELRLAAKYTWAYFWSAGLSLIASYNFIKYEVSTSQSCAQGFLSICIILNSILGLLLQLPGFSQYMIIFQVVILSGVGCGHLFETRLAKGKSPVKVAFLFLLLLIFFSGTSGLVLYGYVCDTTPKTNLEYFGQIKHELDLVNTGLEPDAVIINLADVPVVKNDLFIDKGMKPILTMWGYSENEIQTLITLEKQILSVSVLSERDLEVIRSIQHPLYLLLETKSNGSSIMVPSCFKEVLHTRSLTIYRFEEHHFYGLSYPLPF